MIRVYESKLYPTPAQAATLERWLRQCQRVYNWALEHRIKAYRRRGESISYFDQTALVALRRKAMPAWREVPSDFLREALQRLGHAFKAFFRRVKSGAKPGFPRFRAHTRYRSMASLRALHYLRGTRVHIPNLGPIRRRDSGRPVTGKQKCLRLVKRATGWYAQVTVDDGLVLPKMAAPDHPNAIGLDLGLESFAAVSDGERIKNPRWLEKAERELRRAHRNVSRKQKGSRNRRKAVARLARTYERVVNLRKNFLHHVSNDLAARFRMIAVEDLNIRGMARGRLGKSILDAAWGQFLRYLDYKAERAGCRVVRVDPRGTSQECSGCGAIIKKELSDRVHRCSCGAELHRDVNAARNILARGRRAAACGGDVRPARRDAARRPHGSRKVHQTASRPK